MTRALMLLTALLLAGCGGTETVATSGPGKPSAEPKVDSLTEASCRHFRNVMGDIDVLTAEELRKKLKEVHDKGQYAEATGVPEASRSMLSAATSDDGEAFLEAIGEMSQACKTAGV